MAHRVMDRPWTGKATWIAGALALALVLLLSSASPAWASESSGRLVVTGRAQLAVEPDMAVFQVGVETRGGTVEEAREANAAAMQGVQARLLEAGIDPAALKTRGFDLYPEWHYDRDTGERTLIGYRAVHTLEVRVDDLGRLGELMDAAMEEGANQVSSPVFGLKNPEALELEALREAVRRARTKAETLAAASGAFLKGIVEIRESVNTPIGGELRVAAAAYSLDAVEKTTTSISPGEVSVTATVTITYRI